MAKLARERSVAAEEWLLSRPAGIVKAAAASRLAFGSEGAGVGGGLGEVGRERREAGRGKKAGGKCEVSLGVAP